MKMKKMMLMFAVLIITAYAHGDVILTGIMDGTLAGGKPKAIELFIAGTEDLGGYELWRSLNGDPFGAGAGSIAALSGIYSNTFVYLVKSDQVVEFQNVFGSDGFYANIIPLAIVSGNGNEGYQLRDTVGDVVIDQLWMEDPADTYRDSYWYRKNGTGPDGTWLEANWIAGGNDALDDLDEAGLRSAVPFGSYALVWQGITDAWDDILNWSPAIIPSGDCNVVVPDSVLLFPEIMSLPGSPAICYNLAIEDTARITVRAGKALTVLGDLTLEETQNSDKLILEPGTSARGSGSLMLMGETVSPITARLNFPQDNSWHFLASPVSGQEIQPGFVPDTLGNTFDFYSWQESEAMASGWMNIRDPAGILNPVFDTALLPGKGYLAAYSAIFSGDPVRVFKGIPGQGNMDLPLSHEQNTWNLLGNPYTCAIDWSSEGVDKTLVAGGAMYIWDQELNAGEGAYRTHNGIIGVPENTAPIIPAMNGFFVSALDTGSISLNIMDYPTLTHSSMPFYKEQEITSGDLVRLSIHKDDYFDEALVILGEGGNSSYDPLKDALKLTNGIANAPEISTSTDDGKEVCINYTGLYPVTVPVNIFYEYPDSLEIRAFNFEGLDSAVGLFLEDRLTGATLNLREQNVYTFRQQLPGLPQRFLLHFTNVASIEEQGQNIPDCYIYERRIYFREPPVGGSLVILYDISGRTVFKATTGSVIDLHVYSCGTYILEVRSGGKSSRKKIIL